MTSRPTSALDLSHVRKVFGGEAKIPNGTVVALRSVSKKRTFAVKCEGQWTAGEMNGLNDCVEKLWVAEGWVLETYEHSGLTGKKYTYHCPPRGRLDRSHHTYLGGTHIWGRVPMKGVSSIKVYKLDYTVNDITILWTGDRGSKSDAKTLLPGDYKDLSSTFDDDANWIYAPKGLRVKCYEHNDYKGKEWLMRPGINDLKKINAYNEIDSIKIEQPDWKLVTKTILWKEKKERKLEPSISRFRQNNYGCGILTKTLTMYDNEGTEHSIEWAAGSETTVTVSASVEVGANGPVAASYSQSLSQSLSLEYGEGKTSFRERGLSVEVSAQCPAHSGIMGSLVVNRIETSVPVKEVFRDPETGRTCDRRYILKSKYGIEPESSVYPVKLNAEKGKRMLKKCPFCGKENVAPVPVSIGL